MKRTFTVRPKLSGPIRGSKAIFAKKSKQLDIDEVAEAFKKRRYDDDQIDVIMDAVKKGLDPEVIPNFIKIPSKYNADDVDLIVNALLLGWPDPYLKELSNPNKSTEDRQEFFDHLSENARKDMNKYRRK